MGKPPDRTPGKKAPTPPVKREPTGPMTLGTMRSLGPRSLDVTCKACGHRTAVNGDAWPDDTFVPSLGPHMRFTKCGHLGASARPDWSQLRGIPSRP